MTDLIRQAEAFSSKFGWRVPILLAPMAGACPPALSIAVSEAGGLGAGGVLLMTFAEILEWTRAFRAGSSGAFQLNIWIPDPAPTRDSEHEARIRAFLGCWGPPPAEHAGNVELPNFDEQCAAMLEAGPPVLSSIMGLFAPAFVRALKTRGIAWFATVTTVAEARAAEAAGADVIVAQGAEAGGHRGCFDPDQGERRLVGLFSLLPAVVDAVSVPVVAAGGIADARGVAAALMLGASAVQIGTGFLRCPESGINGTWADALAETAPEDTLVSRVFSGRAGRSIATEYVQAATAPDAPAPASSPVQRGLTAAMRANALRTNSLAGMQAWAGQSAGLARAEPAGHLLRKIWEEAQRLLA